MALEPATRGSRGGFVVPLYARVVYQQGELRQVRQAHVSCQLNAELRALAVQ
jgi:hypothetical protein